MVIQLIVCLKSDILHVDTFPNGTTYGSWTFIHNNPGVDQNIQTVINDYSINKNKSLIKIIDLLGRKRLEIVKTSYSLFMKMAQ